MSDLNNQLRRYIDGLEEPVSINETTSRSRQRPYRVPAALLAGAAIVLLPALILIGLRWLPGDSDIAEPTTVPPIVTIATTTTTLPETTTIPSTTVAVPDVVGLSVGEAQAALERADLEWTVVAGATDSDRAGTISEQEPDPGSEVPPGSLISIVNPQSAGCLEWNEIDRVAPPAGEMEIEVIYQCDSDWSITDYSTAATYRVIPTTPDVVEATVRALVAGPTEIERNAGFDSFFTPESSDAVNSVSLDGSRLTVDFNDAILINNASTSTGGLFFMAELQANLFQFDEVDSMEFQLDGSCDAFSNWLQSDCQIMERSEWEQRVESWTEARQTD